MMVVATIGAFIGIGIAYSKYIKKSEVPARDEEVHGFSKVLLNKFYVDEIYTALFVTPIYWMGDFFKQIVEVIISYVIFGLGKAVNLLSDQGRTLQNGSVGLYLFVFVLGFSTIVYYIFLA